LACAGALSKLEADAGITKHPIKITDMNFLINNDSPLIFKRLHNRYVFRMNIFCLRQDALVIIFYNANTLFIIAL
jgi:hypothetical protein